MNNDEITVLPKPEECTLEQLEQYLHGYNIEIEHEYYDGDSTDTIVLAYTDGQYYQMEETNRVDEAKISHEGLIQLLIRSYLAGGEWKPKEPLWPYRISPEKRAEQERQRIESGNLTWRESQQKVIDEQGRKMTLTSVLSDQDFYYCDLSWTLLDYSIVVSRLSDGKSSVLQSASTNVSVNTHFRAKPDDIITITIKAGETLKEESATVTFPDVAHPSDFIVNNGIESVPFEVVYHGPVDAPQAPSLVAQRQQGTVFHSFGEAK